SWPSREHLPPARGRRTEAPAGIGRALRFGRRWPWRALCERARQVWLLVPPSAMLLRVARFELQQLGILFERLHNRQGRGLIERRVGRTALAWLRAAGAAT